MAVELCPAPRISFSHGFCSSSISPVFSLPFMDSSNFNVDLFEFDIRIDNINEESYSSAEELFCNGKILPREIKKKQSNNIPPSSKQELITQKPQLPHQPKITSVTSSKIINEEITNSNNQNRSKGSKSLLWRFKRSYSLNFITGNKKKLCSSDSSSLSRSSSEGSVPKVIKPFLQSSSTNSNTQKSNMKKKKNTCGYNNGYPAATINPILNVPLVDFFCVSSVFFNGKSKKKR